MKPLILFLLFMVGCVSDKREPTRIVNLPDTLTVVYSREHNGYFGDTPEEYALKLNPNYAVVSVRFLGVANDPDCYYEVRLVKCK